MEDAWMRERDGRFTPVTAAQVQGRYRGHIPATIRFVCPICRQPLVPAAMSLGSIQSPHFRHQGNNPSAQLCERFSRGYGGYASALYQRMPLPMFISRGSPSSQVFVVTGGFRSPNQGTLDVLCSSGARLLVGSREYAIDERRFGKSIARIPFDELSLKPMRYVSLKDSPLPIESVWGLPEDSRSVMVFTRDVYTGQGKRVRRGEEVTYGEAVYLLAPRASADYAAERIPGCKRVGHVQCRLGASTLQVLSARVPSRSGMTREALAIFEAEGISVREDTSAPELIWPPALRADGVERVLPEYEDAIFATKTPTPGDDMLYVYGGSSMLDETGLLVTETPGSFEQAVILEASDDALYAQVRSYDVGFESEGDGTVVRVRLTKPLGITCLRPNLPPSRQSKLGEWLTFDVGRTGMLRVDKRLDGRRGAACLWQHLPVLEGHSTDPEDLPSDARSSMNRGRDIALATDRKLGSTRIDFRGRDRSLAAARRNSQ